MPEASVLIRLTLATAALAAAAILMPSVPAPAQEPAGRLEGVERKLERARARQAKLDGEARQMKAAIGRMRRDLVAAAKAIQEHEAAVSALEVRLTKLSAEAKRKRAALVRQQGRLASTLAVLQRLARYPEAMIIAAPGDPNDTLRGTLLLRAVVPQLETRARALQRELAQLGDLRRKIARERRVRDRTARKLAVVRARLKTMLRKKQQLAAVTKDRRSEQTRRMAALTSEAGTLRELLAGIEKERKTRPPAARRYRPRFEKPLGVRAFSKARGRMRLPARGLIVHYFGQPNDLGRRSKGLTIETRGAAQVIAPFDGKIVFTGPFRGYGRILIIEHGEGYHTLLAGFSRIDVVPDQWLLAGEPVGILGRPESGNPSLYMELRSNGRPINPLPWLAARN